MPLMAGTSSVFCAGRNIRRLGAERQRALVGLLRIDHAERHRRRAGPMRGDEVKAVGAGLLR